MLAVYPTLVHKAAQRCKQILILIWQAILKLNFNNSKLKRGLLMTLNVVYRIYKLNLKSADSEFLGYCLTKQVGLYRLPVIDLWLITSENLPKNQK
jgi:hypothetical protein